MLQELLLFAQKEDLNKWLDEHPAVLGGLFMILGFGIALYGVYELKTGVTRDKKGASWKAAERPRSPISESSQEQSLECSEIISC
ncbi:hypothetical protein OAF42_02550 [Planctomicrobium sp.]|mgnify:CR=1 FL=1|nr:hypothetical protein [Planctomicrobium sp.]MDA7503726.1 hypothetical protein [bacterium]MDA7527766.1 hypothetical protein [bacterium]MDB4733303.1 hypothetical protein [Planctomicrobium sp.]MDB4802359.1 hypothetical protein [bacterium]